MKKTFKIIFVFVIIISIAFYVVYKQSSSYAFDYNVRRSIILNNSDNRLDELFVANEIAKGYIDIYTINSKEKYIEVKQTLYNNLSEKMKKEFDLLEDNIPLSEHTINYSIN